MSAENDQVINAFVAKIKQDKLDQRRTVLSTKDQAFLNAVGAVANDFDIELPPSVAGIVQEPAREYPELNDQAPKRAALIAAGYTTDDAAKALSKEELLALDDIGDVTAEKIIDFYAPHDAKKPDA